MALYNYIKDPNNGKMVNVIEKDGYNGLYVITNELKEYRNKSVLFTNPTYGSDMAQNFAGVASTENVHNGEDNTYWAATTIVGNPSDFDFNSDTYAYTGTYSIDCTKAEEGDSFQLANDTEILPSAYDSFVGWIYITGNWNNIGDGVEVILYNTNLGIQVSNNSVNISDYINGTTTNIWQRFNIPLSDFGLVSNNYDSMRFTITAQDGAPNFYLDDLKLLDLLDDPAIFSISPPRDKWWHIQGFGLGIAATYDSTLADSSLPKIPYKGLLGQTLTNGITYQRQEEGEILYSFVMNNLMDILQQYNTRITSQGTDGTYTWIKIDMDFRFPFILKSENEDYISFNVADDLSGLEYFRVVADIREEDRTNTGKSYYIGDR